jgi:GNAT superfamily N-acetyltransferase
MCPPGAALICMHCDFIPALDETHVVQLFDLYQREWWSRHRRLSDVRAMLGASDLVFGFVERDTRQLAAFSRVLTDFVYKAIVFDVIVAAPHRKTGLGRRLLETVVHDPRLRPVQHIELYCRPNLVAFYRKFGFTDELGDLTFMRVERDGPA